MSNSQREAIKLLTEIWELSPEIRLGQLLGHLELLGDAHFDKRFGDIEDDEILSILRRHHAELIVRQRGEHSTNAAPVH